MMWNRLFGRFAAAIDRATQSVADDIQASAYYGIEPSRLWAIRCWIVGFLEGLARRPDKPSFASKAEYEERQEWLLERL